MAKSRKKENWEYSQSTKILKELSNHLMFELNISGIESGMKELSNKHDGEYYAF